MGGCTVCTKFLLATVNIVTIMLGIVLAAAGIVVLVKGHVYFPEVPKYSETFHTPCAILIVCGIFIVGMGVFGAYSAFSGRPNFLNCFFFIIVSLTLLEIAALAALAIKRVYVLAYLMSNFEQWFINVNNENATELQMMAVSIVQLELECCGMDKVDPSQCNRGICYSTNSSMSGLEREIDGTQYWTMWNRNNRVPASCCGTKAKPTSAAYFCNRYQDPKIQKTPCYPILITWLEYGIYAVLGVLGGLILLNVGVTFSAKWLRNKEREDDYYLYTRYNSHDDRSNSFSDFTEKTRSGHGGGHVTQDTGFNSTWL